MKRKCLFPGCTETPAPRNICPTHLDTLNDFARPEMAWPEFYAGVEKLVMRFAKAGGNTSLLGTGCKW